MTKVLNFITQSSFYLLLTKRLEQIFHFFIPLDPSKDKAQLSREKYHVLFLLASVITYFLITITLVIIKGKSYSHPLNTWMHHITLGISVLNIAYLKWTKNIRQSLIIFTLNIFLVNIVSILLTGGVYSTETIWQIMLIMSSTLLISRKFGLIMVLLSATCALLMYKIEHVWKFEGLVEYIDSGPSFRLGALYLFFSVFYLISSAIVYNREKMQKTIEEIKQNQIDIIDSQYKFIIENTSLVVGLHNIDGKRTYASEAVKSILGYSPIEMVKKWETDFLSPKDQKSWDILVNACVSRKKIVSGNLQYVHQNGNLRYLQASLKPIFNSDRSFEAIISSLKDVTEDKILEIKLKETKHQIAQDFHDEIGNKLAVISSKANLLSRKAGLIDEDELANTAKKIEQNTLNLYRDFKDFIWTVEGQESTFSDLYYYLKSLLEEAFIPLGIVLHCRCKLPELIEGTVIDSYKKKNIISIIKEATSNVLKHAKATQVKFEISTDQQFIHFLLEDNGVGSINDPFKPRGMGLKNMAERSRKIGVQLSVNLKDNGQIKISIPHNS